MFKEAFKQIGQTIGHYTIDLVPKDQRWKVERALVGAAIAIVAVFSLAGLSIYGLGGQGSVERFMGRLFPYPAAFVDHNPVSFADYSVRRQQLASYNAYLAKNGSGTYSAPSEQELNREALSQAVNQYFVRTYANSHNLSVASSEINKAEQDLFNENGGEKQALKALGQQFGLDKTDLETVLRDQLLLGKVETAVQQDSGATADAKAKMNGILNQLLAGANFDELAIKNSQDITATQGTAGAVDVATLPQSIQVATSAVGDGELVKQIFSVNNTFYIVRRVQTVGQTVLVRTIVMHGQSFEQWESAQAAASRIVNLLPQVR